MEAQFIKSYKKSNNKTILNKTLSLPSPCLFLMIR